MKTIKIVLLIAVVTFSAVSFTLKTEKGYRIGDIIEDFTLKNIDDTMVSLSDYKEAKGFIIIFTCNMCPYSVANEDRIIALDAKYKLDLIQDFLAAKEIYIARHYIKKKKWIPAINRLKTIVNEYNTTIYIEEALHRLVEIHYKIGLIEKDIFPEHYH